MIALCLAAVALVASGCGDDERDKYRDGLDDASDTFVKELNRGLAIMRQRRSPSQYGAGAQGLQAATTQFQEDLEKLDTPSDAEDEEKALLDAVAEFGDAVGSLNAAVQAKDNKQIAAEGARLTNEAGAVDQGIERLKEAVE
jgi:Lon protease-like protein